MKLAGIGASSVVLNLICAVLLFVATQEDSKRNALVLIYILKNVCVICVNFYFISRLIVKNAGSPKQVLEKELFAVGSSTFDVVASFYFGLVALFFYLEDDTDDDNSDDVEPGKKTDKLGLRNLKDKKASKDKASEAEPEKEEPFTGIDPKNDKIPAEDGGQAEDGSEADDESQAEDEGQADDEDNEETAAEDEEEEEPGDEEAKP